MEVENINQNNFVPQKQVIKSKKRCAPSDEDNQMIIDETSGIEGIKKKSQERKTKRIKSDLRKIPVPSNRLLLNCLKGVLIICFYSGTHH